MNTEPCQRPTWKLSVAFAGMCWLMVEGACGDMLRRDFETTYLQGNWLALFWKIVSAGLGIWVAWLGAFRGGSLQLMWGWSSLLVGFAGLVFAALDWLGVTEPTKSMPLDVVAMPVIGWLLVFDRDVARYRAHLRELESERRRLRFEQQDLENERRRLGLENQNL